MLPTEVWFVLVLVVGWSQLGDGLPREYEQVPYHPSTYKIYKNTHDHQPAPKYDFEYAVRDDHYGPNYGAAETRDGYDTKGSYFVDLPDGRRQTVTYYVSKDSGFVADVTYEYTGKVHGHTPQKNLAKGYRQPEPVSEESLEHVYHHHAEPGYKNSDGVSIIPAEPVYKTSEIFYQTSQPDHQIYQTSEPGYKVSEHSSQTSQPSYRTSEISYQTSDLGYRASNPNYQILFTSPSASQHPFTSSGISQRQTSLSNTEALHGSTSKFDGSHAVQQNLLQIRRAYQEIPAPKPVVVNPHFFSSAHIRGDRQHSSTDQNELLSESSIPGNQGESQGSLHQGSHQGDQGESQGLLNQFTRQGIRGESEGSLQQGFQLGNGGESQGTSHSALRLRGESLGSLHQSSQQEFQGELHESSQKSTQEGVRGESRGPLQQGSDQGTRGESQGSQFQFFQPRNPGELPKVFHPASPIAKYHVSPVDYSYHPSTQGNYNFENIHFYPDGEGYNTPTGEYSFLKPPLVKTIREIEQYNIDAAEYI